MIYTFNKIVTSVNSMKEGIKNSIDEKLNKVRTSSVGIIKSFDAETQTAVIQPAIKKFIYTDKGKTFTLTPTAMPLLVNVPVQFPGGGDWHLTFPIKAEDECILIYAERSLDNWKKYGGLVEQSNLNRRHSVKDAIAIVGVHSQPTAISDYNASEPELRNADASIKLTFSSTGMKLVGDLEVEGSIIATEDISTDLGDITSKTVTLATHTHVTTATVGPSATPGIIDSPTPGT